MAEREISGVTLRCLCCGNSMQMNATLAERCFGPAPDGVSDADSDGCNRCCPTSAIYPSGWATEART